MMTRDFKKYICLIDIAKMQIDMDLWRQYKNERQTKSLTKKKRRRIYDCMINTLLFTIKRILLMLAT